MENRIQINGEWYIKESDINTTICSGKAIHDISTEVHKGITLTYETDKYYFESVNNMEENDTMIFINFTDKRIKPWKEDFMDNNAFFIGIYNNDIESEREALKIMDNEGLIQLKAFINHLVKINWLKV